MSGKAAKQASPQEDGTAFARWRLELYFKSAAELTNVALFLQQHGISRINITNKVSLLSRPCLTSGPANRM